MCALCQHALLHTKSQQYVDLCSTPPTLTVGLRAFFEIGLAVWFKAYDRGWCIIRFAGWFVRWPM